MKQDASNASDQRAPSQKFEELALRLFKVPKPELDVEIAKDKAERDRPDASPKLKDTPKKEAA